MPGKRNRPTTRHSVRQTGTKRSMLDDDTSFQLKKRFERQNSSSNHQPAPLTDRFRYVKPGSQSTSQKKSKLESENSPSFHYSCTSPLTKPDEDNNVEPDVQTEMVESKDEALKLLKHFDMLGQYGACTGLTRLQRWQRAEKFNLNPPAYVPKLIAKFEGDEEIENGIWHKYRIF